MILLDTHTLLWYLEGERKLGRLARAVIDKALERAEVFVSAISFWELAMLVEKRRLKLATTVSAFRVRAMTQGIDEEAIDGYMAITAAELPAVHGDPRDRMIVATALLRGYTLITADQTLLDWKMRGFKSQDATV